MNNEIKNSLLKAAYNLLEENPEQFILNTVQVIISAVVEMTDMEMPDENNDAEPFYDEESNIMYHDGKDARIAYLKSIIDAKNIKIAELEKTISNLKEVVRMKQDFVFSETGKLQKEIVYLNKRIQDKNSEISALEKHLNNNSQLKSVLENNKIRLIKAIRRALKDDKYDDADVRDDKYGSKYNHISNLKQSKDLFEEILRNVIE